MSLDPLTPLPLDPLTTLPLEPLTTLSLEPLTPLLLDPLTTLSLEPLTTLLFDPLTALLLALLLALIRDLVTIINAPEAFQISYYHLMIFYHLIKTKSFHLRRTLKPSDLWTQPLPYSGSLDNIAPLIFWEHHSPLIS
jgi:hypothetical protein